MAGLAGAGHNGQQIMFTTARRTQACGIEIHRQQSAVSLDVSQSARCCSGLPRLQALHKCLRHAAHKCAGSSSNTDANNSQHTDMHALHGTQVHATVTSHMHEVIARATIICAVCEPKDCTMHPHSGILQVYNPTPVCLSWPGI
jgi:hypothetical protein